MKTQYITNEKGKKVAVVIPMKDYEQIIEDLEMLADIRAYDEVKSFNEPSVPYAKAIKQIAAKRRRKK